MKRSIVISVIISLFLLIPSKTGFSVDNKTVQIKKQTELQQVKPKRSGESKYTWDLTGDDVDEIVRTDKRLKKLLNIE
jgi:hypothetical protein